MSRMIHRLVILSSNIVLDILLLRSSGTGLQRRRRNEKTRKEVQNDKKEHSRRGEPSRTLAQRVRQLLDRDCLAKCSIPLSILKESEREKEPETMSSLMSSTPEVSMKTGSTKDKSRRTQAEVGRSDEIPLPLHINTFFICRQKSHDLQQVRAKCNSKEMAANVAKIHK